MSRQLSAIEKEDERLFNTPQKWYVRRKWLEYSINRMRKNNRSFIRLLTLTCTQVYEIRLLLDNGLLLHTDSGAFDEHCLAFCEMVDHRYVLIRDALPGARNFLGRLEDLVGAGRIGYSNRIDSWFPFDVINLDINECILKRDSRIIEAIWKLFIIQKMKNQSFTLFLTICSVESGNDKEKIKALYQSFEMNLTELDIEEIFHVSFPDGVIKAYHDLQSLIIPKKIIEYGLSEGFDIQYSEKLTYIGEGLSTRMLSFIFDCEYCGPREIAYLGSIRRDRILSILDHSWKDIDQILQEDVEASKVVMDLKSKYSDQVSY